MRINRHLDEPDRLYSTCELFEQTMNDLFSTGSQGIMGFRVNKNLHNAYSKNESIDNNIKLYINAESDTYVVARLFQEECEKENIPYYYKVANAGDMEEIERIDRLCIYSDYEHVSEYVRILDEIKHKHAEIKFKKPPITTGILHDYIGIGQDKEGVYNWKMSSICYGEINKILGHIPKDKVVEYVQNYPNLIEILKNNLKQATKNNHYSDKICICESEVEKVKNIKLNNNKTNDNELNEMLSETEEQKRVEVQAANANKIELL